MTADILLVLLADLLIGGLFLMGGIGKLADFGTFIATLDNYRLLPSSLVRFAALLIVIAELLLGLMAVLGLRWGSQAGLSGLSVLLVGYALAIAVNLLRGHRNIDCGCAGFGVTRSALDWGLVVRNVLLAAIASLIAALPVHERVLGTIDWISGFGAFVAFALLYHAADQLITLRSMKGLDQ